MFDLGNNVDHACLKVIIPFEHAPTPTPDANEMVGELINPTHVLAKEMVVIVMMMKKLMKDLFHRNLKVIFQSNCKVDNSLIEDSSMTYASCKILLKHLIIFSNLRLAEFFFFHV